MDLSLQTQQKQMLSPKMQQSAKILQMNTITLCTYLQELVEENPLLEWKEENLSAKKEDVFLQKMEWLQSTDTQNHQNYRDNQDERDNQYEKENHIYRKNDDITLREYLLFQINILSVNRKKKQVLRFLAENITESGYLAEYALENTITKFHLSPDLAEEILHLLQSLEPSGVGARNLKECLLIQLQRKNASKTAQSIVLFHLEDLGKNRTTYIAKKLHVSTDVFLDALAEIKSCMPKPGNGFANLLPIAYITPDVYVKKEADDLLVTINSEKVPQLFLNPVYTKLLHEDIAKETKAYIVQKLQQAEWIVQCVKQREETLRKTTEAIVSVQKNFFLLEKGELAPLRMQDIAQALHLHISTISRAVKEKYLQCEKGIFPLSAFFVKGLEQQGQQISTDHIRRQIHSFILEEDKAHPISDKILAEKLQEQGIVISRRTIAKYREQMQIPNTAKRKENHHGK